MPPAQALIDTQDNPDVASEVSQRVASVGQTLQGVLSTWAIYGQRDQIRATGVRQEGGREAGGEERGREVDRSGTETPPQQDTQQRREEISVDEPPAAAPRAARVRPLIAQDAGLDACGPGSTLSEPQQDQVRRQFRIVPDPDEVAARTSALAADDAAQAGSLLAAADDNTATIPLIGGTNPRAGRGPRVRDAIGVASAHVAEEAQDTAVDDPLGAPHGLGDDLNGRDPLTVNAWEANPPATGEAQARGR